MKKIVLFLSFLFLFLACKKEEIKNDPIPYFGNATANKNEQQWNAKIGAGSTPRFGNYFAIGMDNFNSMGFRRGHLSIYKIPKEIGKFEIHKTNSLLDDGITGAFYAAYIDDGDLLAGTWYTAEANVESSWIEIKSIDNNTNIISGAFHLELEIDSTTIDSRYFESGETSIITFKDGLFTTKIVN